MSDQVDLVKLGDLAYELAEARSEIRRHHEDFEKIRTILLAYAPVTGELAEHALTALIRDIRQVVG